MRLRSTIHLVVDVLHKFMKNNSKSHFLGKIETAHIWKIFQAMQLQIRFTKPWLILYHVNLVALPWLLIVYQLIRGWRETCENVYSHKSTFLLPKSHFWSTQRDTRPNIKQKNAFSFLKELSLWKLKIWLKVNFDDLFQSLISTDAKLSSLVILITFQLTFICLKLTMGTPEQCSKMETPEQCVKSIQS